MIGILDILGWTGNIGFIIGAILIAKKNKLGFVSNMYANFIYAIVGVTSGLSSLLVISTILIVINIMGFHKWAVNDCKQT